MNRCRVCGGHTEPLLSAQELMLGLGGAFAYDRCSDCGTWQIASIPDDLASYYPQDDYYSMSDSTSGLRSRLRVARLQQAVRATPLSRQVFERVVGVPPAARWFRRIGARPGVRTLDVGCGHGAMIDVLAAAGFGQVRGVDPFVPEDIHHPSGATVTKGTLADIAEDFDVVMFHHSLEHVPDPVAELTLAAQRLAPGGHVIVRTPVVGTFASEHFREFWAQLDAPRHLVLLSLEGMAIAASNAGLELVATEFDSTDFPLWASDLYHRGRPLSDGPPSSRADRTKLKRRAAELNSARDGDQACFYLRRASASSPRAA